MHTVTTFVELDLDKSKFELCMYYGFALGGGFFASFSPAVILCCLSDVFI